MFLFLLHMITCKIVHSKLHDLVFLVSALAHFEGYSTLEVKLGVFFMLRYFM